MTVTCDRNAPLDSVPTFKHAPLDHTKASIRLLKISPQLSDIGLVQCEIWHDTIEATYDCLSYVWGSEEDQQNILMNHQLFRVRRNLWNFLAVARTKYAAAQRTFWIDAVCIDQGSISERNHQVAQMGLIYSKADEVIAWLGTEGAIHRALMFCDELATLKSAKSSREAADLWQQRETERGREFTNEFKLFSGSPYWNRAWITQEILLARKVTMLVNDYECGPDGILQLTYLHFPWLPFPSVTVFIVLMEVISGKRSIRGESLVSLLYHFRERECLIPRDQIYSLVSVAGDAHAMLIDYGGTPDQFLDQVLCTLEHSLCLCSWVRIRETLRLPSHHYGPVYREPIFIVQMRRTKATDDSDRGWCRTCDVFDGEKDNCFATEFRACIRATCARYDSHYLLRTHQLSETTKFTLETASTIPRKAEVIYVESEAYVPGYFGGHFATMINVYLKATELERIMGYDTTWRKSICSNADDGKGCMSVYRGAPLGSTQQPFKDTSECSFVRK